MSRKKSGRFRGIQGKSRRRGKCVWSDSVVYVYSAFSTEIFHNLLFFPLFRQQPQKQSSVTLALPPPNQEREGGEVEVPSNIFALDRLIRDATATPEKKLSLDFVQQLAQVAMDIKSDMSKVRLARQKAEAKLNASAAVDKDMEYELASSREHLREARDQILDVREEAEQLQAEVASLRLQLEKMSGTKRTFEDRCESEGYEDGDDDDDDDNSRSRDGKRQRGDYVDSIQV